MEICSNAIKSLQVTVIRYIEECWLSFLKSLENTEEPVKNRWSFKAQDFVVDREVTDVICLKML